VLEEVGELGDKDDNLCRLFPCSRWGCSYLATTVRHRLPALRATWLLHALIAKEVYQFPTREALYDALKPVDAASALWLGEVSARSQPLDLLPRLRPNSPMMTAPENP